MLFVDLKVDEKETLRDFGNGSPKRMAEEWRIFLSKSEVKIIRNGLNARLMESDFKFVMELRNYEAQSTPENSRAPRNYGKVISTRCMVSG
jgi:hypothetical protein